MADCGHKSCVLYLVCQVPKRAVYNAANKERRAVYYAANKERAAASYAVWYAANRQHDAARHAAWRIANPLKALLGDMRSNARKRALRLSSLVAEVSND